MSTATQQSLQQRLAELERERDELKRRSEDLQFELEELHITKADVEQEQKDLVKKVSTVNVWIYAIIFLY